MKVWAGRVDIVGLDKAGFFYPTLALIGILIGSLVVLG